jgi:nucleoside-diphosphate-sugar epimerase
MRVVVTGATGNVGTSLLTALAEEPTVTSILGLARRRPRVERPKVEWASADIVHAPLADLFRGADAVVHLAWLIQPSHDREALRETNVTGSARVFEAVSEADVPVLVYASSVGAYSPGPKDEPVDESWPTEGVQTSFYGQDKAAVERLLDDFEPRNPGIRVVRLRPGLIFKAEAATGIRRLFVGPFAPPIIFTPKAIPAVPDIPRLRFQAVHADDVAQAYRLALTQSVSGPFNVAAEPVLDPPRLAELLGARLIRFPPAALRAAAAASWRLHLQPTPPGWIDLALGVPIMDTARARTELGWSPAIGAGEALLELLDGMRRGQGFPTPPLDPASSGKLRSAELRTRVGGKAY